MGMWLFDLCALSLFLVITLTGLAGGGVLTGFRFLLLVLALGIAFGLRPFLAGYTGAAGFSAVFALLVPFVAVFWLGNNAGKKFIPQVEQKLNEALHPPLGLVFGLANGVVVLTALWTGLLIATPTTAETLGNTWSVRGVRLLSEPPLEFFNARLEAEPLRGWQVPTFSALPSQQPAGRVLRLQDGTEIVLEPDQKAGGQGKRITREAEIGELRDNLREEGFERGAGHLDGLQGLTDSVGYGGTGKARKAEAGDKESAIQQFQETQGELLDAYQETR